MWQPVAWFRDHVRVAGESLGFVSARLWTSFLVWLVVGIALALPAGLWLLQINMEQMSAGWEGRPGVSVYFDMDARAEEIDIARQHLAAHLSVASVSVTTAEEALEDTDPTGLDLGSASSVSARSSTATKRSRRIRRSFSIA